MITPSLNQLWQRAQTWARRGLRSSALRQVVRRLAPLAVAVRRTWRRSLQLRMVVITVLASSVLVGGFGLLVARSSTEALVDGARKDARARIVSGVEYARLQLTTRQGLADPGAKENIKRILTALGGRPEQGTGTIVAMRSDKMRSEGVPTVLDEQLGWPEDASAAIPQELRDSVVQGNLAHTIVKIDNQAYLVYGSTVPTRFEGGQVELYFFTPLGTEVGVAQSIQTTIVITGAVLVLLLSISVALITRMVVRPVRLAARTAQRLSAGLLDQRMDVKGEDELALLAAAFNQMAENLQRQIVRLEEMSRLQRRFTSDVSHELRTPLTTVRMAADLLHDERENFDPAMARSVELLQKELDRFEELLTDLLEISRFDAGFAMLDAEAIDVIPVVKRVTEQLGPVAKRAKVKLKTVAPKPPVIAEVDVRRVERVLRNLLGNAIDHGEGRSVTVTVATDGQAVAITVRDHGIGLKPGEDKLVFNRFWRADPSRARQTGGTGLGLSISLEDARLHSGWLEAWGAPGEGAQFRLTLPLRAGSRLTSSPLPLIPLDQLAQQRQPSMAKVTL